MEKPIILSILATFLFCIMKFLEMKYLEKEFKPLKFIVRDAVIIFTSVFIASYIVMSYLDTGITNLFNVITDTKTLNAATTQVFTDVPGF
jgi:hypothetical protein